jgi:hypothetical protein
MLQDKLTKFVFKMKLDLLPINFAVKDSNQSVIFLKADKVGAFESVRLPRGVRGPTGPRVRAQEYSEDPRPEHGAVHQRSYIARERH